MERDQGRVLLMVWERVLERVLERVPVEGAGKKWERKERGGRWRRPHLCSCLTDSIGAKAPREKGGLFMDGMPMGAQASRKDEGVQVMMKT